MLLRDMAAKRNSLYEDLWAQFAFILLALTKHLNDGYLCIFLFELGGAFDLLSIRLSFVHRRSGLRLHGEVFTLK